MSLTHLPTPRVSSLPHVSGLVLLGIWLLASQSLDASIRIIGPLIVLAPLLLWMERVSPYRSHWQPQRAELARDAGVLGLNLLADLVVGIGLSLLALRLSRSSLDLHLAWQLAIGLPLAEFGPYWMHRLSHRGGRLWHAHVLHHLPDKLNAANAFTAHPLNAIWDKLARLLPLILLGFSAEAVLVLSAFALFQGLWVHANLSGRPGWLSLFITTPELHRLHHSTDPRQAGNFGTVIPIWDQLFGSYRRGQVQSVGVFEAGAYPDALDLPALLALPFLTLGWQRRLSARRRS